MRLTLGKDIELHLNTRYFLSEIGDPLFEARINTLNDLPALQSHQIGPQLLEVGNPQERINCGPHDAAGGLRIGQCGDLIPVEDVEAVDL